MDCRNNLSPQGQAAQILVDFLEVAITSVIFHKGLYPPGAFERRKYMSLVVHKAVHPELQDYIHSSVNGLFPFIEKGVVDRIAVVFFNADNTPLEQYIFKLQVNQSYGSNVEETDVEFALRSFIVKLSLSKRATKILPQDCRWEVIAFFRSDAQASGVGAAKLWIPTDSKQWQQPPLITPIINRMGLRAHVKHSSLVSPSLHLQLSQLHFTVFDGATFAVASLATVYFVPLSQHFWYCFRLNFVWFLL